MLWGTTICSHISSHIQRIFLKKVFQVHCSKLLSCSVPFSLVSLSRACDFRPSVFCWLPPLCRPEFSWIHIPSFWLSTSASLKQQTGLTSPMLTQTPWASVSCSSEWHYRPPGCSSQKPGNHLHGCLFDFSLVIKSYCSNPSIILHSELSSLPLPLPWFRPW